jgi:xylulokinase
VVLVDPGSGSIVGQAQAPHTVTGEAGARETDPENWWDALRVALAATGRAGEIGAISVAGQQHGLVVLDEHGRPLRPATLWNDTRSAARRRRRGGSAASRSRRSPPPPGSGSAASSRRSPRRSRTCGCRTTS